MAENSILTPHTIQWVHEKGLCSSQTLGVLTSLNIQHLTTIQLLSIPKLLAKHDAFLHARTGSGKTLAFLIPAIERLKAMNFNESNGVGALILSPTRELTQQIADVLKPLAEVHGFSYSTLTGGAKFKLSDYNKGSVVVVGTPGRVSAIVAEDKTGVMPLHNLKLLILDEADRLLDNGGAFTKQLKQILTHIPEENVQKILVSATVTEKCTKQAKELLDAEFTYISSEQNSSPNTAQIKQNYLLVPACDRLSMLITVLRTLKEKKIIVFFSSCHSAKYHCKLLENFELPVDYCMGREKQSRRTNMYNKFVAQTSGVLLTTGLAERGWDIPGVEWIIQYDPPHVPQDYIHRVGRTARGEGKTGSAVLFLMPEELKYVEILTNMNVDIKEMEFGGELAKTQQQILSVVDKNMELQKTGKVAFKKCLRAYKCHKLKTIFNTKSLNLNDLCKSFGFQTPPVHWHQVK